MNEIQIILNTISHILFKKYTNVLRWTIILQALVEYLQSELLLKIKHSFSMSLMLAKLNLLYFILGIKNNVYDYIVDSVKGHATRFQCY